MATALNTEKLGAAAQAPPLAVRPDDYRWISPSLFEKHAKANRNEFSF